MDIHIQRTRRFLPTPKGGGTRAEYGVVLAEGPRMGVSAMRSMADQLARALANAQGWRGADARRAKSIISKWVKTQQVQGNPYFMWEGILRNGTISEVKRKNLKKSKKVSSLLNTDVYNKHRLF